MKLFRIFATMAITAACLSACVSSPSFTSKEGQIRASRDEFVIRSLETFETFTLDNGIPVIIKKNSSNRVFHIRLVLDGGVTLATPDTAGIEGLMLRTMGRGSRRFKYDAIMDLLDSTSSSIGPSLGFDASSYSLNTLDKYFKELFPVWADIVLNPEFAEKDFEQEKKETLLAIENGDQDPWKKTGKVLSSNFFKGHPYESSFEGTRESIGSITMPMVREYYRTTFSANRIFIIAVGNFDIPSLLADLNRTVGKIPDNHVKVPAIEGVKITESGLLKTEFPQSKGLGYLRGDFAAPSPDDPDFIATNVAMKIFADLLFDVVRSKYNAVYSPSAYIRGNRANYGSIVIFKTSSPENIKRYIDEAFSPLLRGECLSTATDMVADHPRQALAEALPVYLAQYSNETFEKSQTNAAVANLIQDSTINTGDYRYFLLEAEQIRKVTQEDIVRSIRRYLENNPIMWNILGSKDIIEKAIETDYAALPGTY